MKPIAFFVFFFPVVAGAVTTSFTYPSLYLGFGVYNPALMKETMDEDKGEPALFTRSHYPIQVRTFFQMTEMFYISPYVSFTHLYPQETPDKGAEINYTLVGLPIVYPINDRFHFDFGLGLQAKNVEGRGGTYELPNGNTKSTSARPGRSMTSYNFYLQQGLALNFGNLNAAVDLYVHQPFSEDRRTFSLLFTMTYLLFGGNSTSGEVSE